MLIFNLINENFPFEKTNSSCTYRTLLYMLCFTAVEHNYMLHATFFPLTRWCTAACSELYSWKARSGYSNSVYAKQRPHRTVSLRYLATKWNNKEQGRFLQLWGLAFILPFVLLVLWKTNVERIRIILETRHTTAENVVFLKNPCL